jgi:hypothetical protein
MAILSALVGMLGRFAGKVLTTTLGWASVLLFGRIPEDRQVRFAILTFGSLVWVATVVGIIVPAAGLFLISLVPKPAWIDENLIRVVMIIAALVLPALLGGVALSIADASDRPAGRGLVTGLLRGYLTTPILAGTLVVLALAGIARKASAAIHRRATGHIPVVVRPGRYDELVVQLDGILRSASLVTGRREGSRLLTGPARLLAAVSGAGLRKLVPDHLVVLTGPEADLELYPSDLSITGSPVGLARTRAAVLRDLDSRYCWFTTNARAQEIEDRLAQVDRSAASWDPAVMREVDRRLANEAIDDEAWDVLYRRRLQLAAQATATNLGEGAGDPTGAGLGPSTSSHAPLVRSPLAALLEPAAGTLVGLVTVGLVIADIALLATRGRGRGR